MDDNNVTITAINIATNRLNWYIVLTIISSSISVIAVIIGYYANKKSHEESRKQLKANHDWNRRSFTINYMSTCIEQIQTLRKELNKLTSEVHIRGNEENILSFSDRFIRGNALTETEIHDWICEWDSIKNEFIKEKADGETFKLTKKGDKIRISLIKLINTYETIGSALKNKVLDEEVVESLMKGPIIANYRFFNLYIEHMRNKHGLINAGKNFDYLHESINPKENKESRQKTDEY